MCYSCGCVCVSVCTSERVSVCSLISHSSYLMSVVSQAAGPISREPRHDSDFCRLVAGGCDSEREGEKGEWGMGGGKERGAGCRVGMAFPHTPAQRRAAGSVVLPCTCGRTLEITKQSPSTTSANYLAESGLGSRIRGVPAVGLD